MSSATESPMVLQKITRQITNDASSLLTIYGDDSTAMDLNGEITYDDKEDKQYSTSYTYEVHVKNLSLIHI